MSQLIQFLGNWLQQDQFFGSHPLAVVPERVNFGPNRFETVQRKSVHMITPSMYQLGQICEACCTMNFTIGPFKQ